MKFYDDLDVLGNAINNVKTPVAATDVANKTYVDGLVPTGGAIGVTTFDANTLLKADTDNTPVALTVGPSTFVGRDAAGSIAALTGTQAKTILGITTADVFGFDIQVRNDRQSRPDRRARIHRRRQAL
jgi:hypothetical protein